MTTTQPNLAGSSLSRKGQILPRNKTQHMTLSLCGTYTSALVVLLLCTVLFAFGALVGEAFPEQTRLALALPNLLLGLSFFISGRVKQLSWTRGPCLVALAGISGIMITLWAQPAYLALGIVLVGADLALVTVLAAITKVDLQQVRGLLSVLAITFSLVGFLLVYWNGFAPWTALWGLAAILCFSLLLMNTVKLALTRMPRSTYTSIATTLFLLAIGLLSNVIILLLPYQGT